MRQNRGKKGADPSIAISAIGQVLQSDNSHAKAIQKKTPLKKIIFFPFPESSFNISRNISFIHIGKKKKKANALKISNA